jgi:hypothetical protein
MTRSRNAPGSSFYSLGIMNIITQTYKSKPCRMEGEAAKEADMPNGFVFVTVSCPFSAYGPIF